MRNTLLGNPDPVYLLRVLLPERMILARILGNIGGAEAAQALRELLHPKEDLVLRVTAGFALRHMKKRASLEGYEITGLGELREGLCTDMSLMQKAREECGKEDALGGILFGDCVRVQTELLEVSLPRPVAERVIGHISPQRHADGDKEARERDAGGVQGQALGPDDSFVSYGQGRGVARGFGR